MLDNVHFKPLKAVLLVKLLMHASSKTDKICKLINEHQDIATMFYLLHDNIK